MPTTAARGRVLLVGATGLVGRAVHALLAPRYQVVTAGPDGCDRFLDLDDCASIVAAVADPGEGGWAAVACAAGLGRFAPLQAITPAPMAQSVYGQGLSNKLLGQVNLALAARGHLRDGGSVTLVTGVATAHTIPGASGFTMANAAIEGFARAAAIEMPRGIRINVVSPGVLDESPAHVFELFAGFEPVPAARVAQAYLRSMEGGQTGQVFTVW
ncbi:MAG: short chain dehydrogenase [Burkholderiaceae bacterium]